jgi:hypothetical protein|tara:strand:- start:374 stop:556 length:183 start_codon:yes stop_codon:yes gene_type:complete
MGKLIEGKYKVIQDYTSIEGALYTNEVVKVYDNNTRPGHIRAKDSMGRVWFIPQKYLKKI